MDHEEMIANINLISTSGQLTPIKAEEIRNCLSKYIKLDEFYTLDKEFIKIILNGSAPLSGNEAAYLLSKLYTLFENNSNELIEHIKIDDIDEFNKCIIKRNWSVKFVQQIFQTYYSENDMEIDYQYYYNEAKKEIGSLKTQNYKEEFEKIKYYSEKKMLTSLLNAGGNIYADKKGRIFRYLKNIFYLIPANSNASIAQLEDFVNSITPDDIIIVYAKFGENDPEIDFGTLHGLSIAKIEPGSDIGKLSKGFVIEFPNWYAYQILQKLFSRKKLNIFCNDMYNFLINVESAGFRIANSSINSLNTYDLNPDQIKSIFSIRTSGTIKILEMLLKKMGFDISDVSYYTSQHTSYNSIAMELKEMGANFEFLPWKFDHEELAGKLTNYSLLTWCILMNGELKIVKLKSRIAIRTLREFVDKFGFRGINALHNFSCGFYLNDYFIKTLKENKFIGSSPWHMKNMKRIHANATQLVKALPYKDLIYLPNWPSDEICNLLMKAKKDIIDYFLGPGRDVFIEYGKANNIIPKTFQ